MIAASPTLRMNHVDRLQLAHTAAACAKWLKACDIEVLAINNGHATPVITVRHTNECDKFDGIVKCFEHNHIQGRKKRYAFVIRYGCEIRWDVQEGGAA